MVKKLFLLDGMALVYRAHFAFINRPILTSKGVNTSALYGFTQMLLDIQKNQQPTHLAVAFDTQAPTQRHVEFADYKAHREEMPEELSAALPHVRRMAEALNVPVLMGDASDNIPGVPGIGEKTAMKLIAQYDTVENLLAHAGELTGRVKQTLETNPEQARLS